MRDMEINIKARDELEETMKRLYRAVDTAVSRIEDRLARINTSRDKDRKKDLDYFKGSVAGIGGLSTAVNRLLVGVDDLNANFSGMVETYLTALEDTRRRSREEMGIGAEVEKGDGGSARGYGGEGYDALLTGQADYHQTSLEMTRRYVEARNAILASGTRQERKEEKDTWDYKLRMTGYMTGSLAKTMENLYVLTGKKHKSMFKVMKAFAVAETVIQTYRAAQGAYAALAQIPVVGPALGVAAAAAAIAAGMARLRMIEQTEPGSIPARVSSGGTAYPITEDKTTSKTETALNRDTLPTQHVVVNIYNPLSEGNWDEISEEIVSALNRAGDRNLDITIRRTEG